MNLKEFALKLREIINFDFLTVSLDSCEVIVENPNNQSGACDRIYVEDDNNYTQSIRVIHKPEVKLWRTDNKKSIVFDEESLSWCVDYNQGAASTISLGFVLEWTNIDFSEYKDSKGEIDYSKCFIEV